MGTRALVHVKTAGRETATLVTIYRQFDGYPTGLGADIKAVLGGREVVNGYTEPNRQVNGMGCAAAMLMAALKDGCGSVYVMASDTADVGEDYTYTVWHEGPALHIDCASDGDSIFSGPLADFDPEKAEFEDAA